MISRGNNFLAKIRARRQSRQRAIAHGVPERRFARSRTKVFAVLPTLLTLGNAACGFGSITFAARVGPERFQEDNFLFFMAALLVFLAMLFDMLDGRAARLFKQTSNFGAELDSLCDAISFGVAPAFLMLRFSRDYHGRLLWGIALLYVLSAVLRLARFNVETDEDDSHDHFSGLPSPAAAGTVVSFPIALRGLDYLEPATAARVLDAVRMGLPFITLAVACLMITRIRYSHVFNQWFRGRRSRRHLILVVFALAVVFLVRELALPLVFCLFAFASPVRAAWNEAWRRARLYKTPAE